MKKINALALSTITAFALIGCGGGSSGGGNSSSSGTVTPTTPVTPIDITVPVITSASNFTVNENQTTAFTVIASDDSNTALTYSLSGTDSSLFDINIQTGIVTFKSNPDYESKYSYYLSVSATDASNNSSTQNVTVNISDIDEIAPTITSNSTFTVNENQTSAFTATATDTSGVANYALSGTDSSLFNINSTSGVVTFKSNTDYETKSSYSIILTATDTLNNSSSQNVTINIANLDETTPTFTSSSTVIVNENQLSVITASATDDSTITYSLNGTDVSYFDINSSSGVITFKTNPDYETKSSYSITVKATDTSNNFSTQNLTVNLNDVDEVAPNITSLSSYSVAENQTSAFTVSATDTSSISYSISGGTDANAFNINSSSGVVTFKTNPDFETKTSYSLTVKATDSSTNFSTKDVTVTITDVVETTGVFKTGQTTIYATGDDGYYASTLGVARSFTRDAIKEIVTDNITKLQWQDDATASTTTANWATAITTCDNLDFGGFTDWRLPTIEELESIVNYGASAPAKYSEFLNFASNSYWSSTTYASNSSGAWSVDFDGSSDGWFDKMFIYYVWCVRAGQ
jgi:hypothetical protein